MSSARVNIALERVAAVQRVTLTELRGKRVTKPLARGRWAVILAASEQLGWSTPRIGTAIGGRDPTTVRAGLSRARALRETDDAFRVLVAVAVGGLEA